MGGLFDEDGDLRAPGEGQRGHNQRPAQHLDVPAASRLSSPAPQQQPLPDVRLSGPVDPTAPAPAPTTTQTNWSSPPAATTETHKTSVGTLVKAGMPINNQPAYTLKTNDGSRWYVQAGPGVDLESLVDRDVECYGKAVYWGDWRANYMVVSRVQAR